MAAGDGCKGGERLQFLRFVGAALDLRADARLQPGAEPWGGGVLYDSLHSVYFTDGLFY